ncbi:hypothetical protein AB1N83_010274 [Pleurotus pulmonarius]
MIWANKYTEAQLRLYPGFSALPPSRHYGRLVVQTIDEHLLDQQGQHIALRFPLIPNKWWSYGISNDSTTLLHGTQRATAVAICRSPFRKLI